MDLTVSSDSESSVKFSWKYVSSEKLMFDIILLKGGIFHVVSGGEKRGGENISGNIPLDTASHQWYD
jgi:hypothetical protein